MPANETKQLQWIKALNRKTLPKQVFICWDHFLDGALTEQNPFPKLNVGYECQTTPSRLKLSRQEPESRKRKRLLEESSSTETFVNINQTEGPSSSELLPEAFCDFNLVNPPMASVGTHYTKKEDVAIMEYWNKKLTTAARDGDIEALKLSLQNGAVIDYQDERGDTALMWAVMRGHLEICRFLIDRGCKIDITNRDGQTALMIAAREGHLEICRLLIDTGCKIDITDCITTMNTAYIY
ncbi:KN motif and ankyrin repeat domain-containing protein 2-like [Mytilus trossulus]|uniref:KN motif and ankyrin repeat domain-containing protein 2-like n=1 Tax=Mytilus trossulus TaxID=6551 RepID=UPI003003DF79